MLTLLTSCGRSDLLHTTIISLLEGQRSDLPYIIVHEDADGELRHSSEMHTMNDAKTRITMHRTCGIGQHASIDQFLKYTPEDKYYLHCEDDWKFDNSYNWIKYSMNIMEADPTVIKVLARKGSPHPCIHSESIGQVFNTSTSLFIPDLKYGYIEPWTNPEDNKTWHGFSWNPGVTRLDLLKKFSPLLSFEQDVAKKIYEAGYKVVELSVPVYEHIGEGRSTH